MTTEHEAKDMSTQDTLPIEQEREKFEAWCVATLNYGYDFSKDAEGDYSHDATETAWFAWEGRAAIAAEEQQAQAFDDLELIRAQQFEIERLATQATVKESFTPQPVQQAQGVPACHKVAPYEPTQEMLIAAKDIDPALPIEHVRRLWWLMWAAAPQAEPEPQEPAQRAEWVGISLGERLDNLMHTAKWDADEVPRLKADLIRDIERCAPAPAASAEPQPERLGMDEIFRLWGMKSDGPSTAEIVSFARAIEQAHGIGAKGGE